mgnify:CR=1 FL=1
MKKSNIIILVIFIILSANFLYKFFYNKKQERMNTDINEMRNWRFIADSRDEATEERLDDLEDAFSLYRCHGIMNCVSVCPKGLNPTEAISNIRNKLLTREKS